MQTDGPTKELRKLYIVWFITQVSPEIPIITGLKIIYAKYSVPSKTCKMRKRLNANVNFANIQCTKMKFHIEEYPSSICQ